MLRSFSGTRICSSTIPFLFLLHFLRDLQWRCLGWWCLWGYMYQFPYLPFAQGLPLPGFSEWYVAVFTSVSMHLLSSGSFPSLLDHSSGIVVMQEDVTIRAVTYPLLFDVVLDFARSSSRLGPPFPVHSHSPVVPLQLDDLLAFGPFWYFPSSVSPHVLQVLGLLRNPWYYEVTDVRLHLVCS